MTRTLSDQELQALAQRIIDHVDHPTMTDRPEAERVELVKDILRASLAEEVKP